MGTEVAEGQAKTGTPPEASPRPDGAPPKRDKPQVTAMYIPGIDGIRGCFLWLLLTYHHGFQAFPGSILAMSMFFTLSGYLITTLVLAEWSRKDRVDVGRFLERRARRLLPAAITAVALVVVLQAWVGLGSGPRFRGDVLGAMGYFANWRSAFSGTSYAALFAEKSPLQHFWSLAVEEQFYLAFPLLFVGAMALGRGRWRLVGLAFGLGALASFVSAGMTAAAHGNDGVAYFATYTRAGEILFGCALAFLVLLEPVKRFLASGVGGRLVRWGGIVGIVGTVWLWWASDLNSPWLFRGATALDAILTALILLACMGRTGVAAKFLELGPMRNVGKLCYSVYLFHWPLFLLLDEERTGLSTWPLFGLRVAVTMVVAAASYHFIECPVREGRLKWTTTRRQVSVVLAGSAAVIVALALAVPVKKTDALDLASLSTDRVEAGSIPVADPPATEPETDATGETGETGPAAPTTPRVLIMGDSVAWSVTGGFNSWNQNQTQQIAVDMRISAGCTLAEPGTVRHLGVVEETTPGCRDLHAQYASYVRDGNYDAVIIIMGGKDIAEREIDGEWRHLGDPVYDEWFTGQAQAFATTLAEAAAVNGTPVLWGRMPHVFVPRANEPSSDPAEYPDNDPARIDRLNEILAQAYGSRPGFQVLDLAGWTANIPGGEDNKDYRADGVHYSTTGAYELTQWIVPQLLDVTGVTAAP